MPRAILIGADSAAAVRKFLIACCGRVARDAADADRDRAELMHRNAELQQQIRNLQQLPRREPGLALNISEPMDRSLFPLGADTPEEEEEEGRASLVLGPIGYGEEGEETDRRSNAAPTADARLPLKLKTCARNYPPHLRVITNSSDEAKKTGWETRGLEQRNCRIRIWHTKKTN
jgi:hypothetical protein